MARPRPRRCIFPSAHEDARHARQKAEAPRGQAPSYRLAFQDLDFLLRDELRPVRLQLELLKPELALQEKGIESTVDTAKEAWAIIERNGIARGGK
jgi:hypothetical protein